MLLKNVNRLFVLSCTSVSMSLSLAACGSSNKSHSNQGGQYAMTQSQLQQQRLLLPTANKNSPNLVASTNDQADAAADLKALADENYNPSQAQASTSNAPSSSSKSNVQAASSTEPSKQDLEKALVAVVALKLETQEPSLHQAADKTSNLPTISQNQSTPRTKAAAPAVQTVAQTPVHSENKTQVKTEAKSKVKAVAKPLAKATLKPQIQAPVAVKKASAYQPILVQTQKFDVNNLKPSQIFAVPDPSLNPANGSAQTGGTSLVLNEQRAAYVYSGASGDNFLASLRLGENSLASQNPAQHELNDELAKRVSSASVRLKGSNQVQVSFILDQKHFKISGPLKPAENGSAMHEAELVSPELPNFKVILTCVDLATKQCLTARVDLIEKVNPQGQEATATLVSRFSGTYVFAEGKGGTGNANEDLWLELTDRTADKKTNNIISAVRLETSETVNGASTYVVSIHAFIDGKDLPTLILKGDLLKENGTNKSDAQVKVLSQQPSVLADSILSAQLVKNDGHGDLMFRLIIKNDRNNTPDKILLTVARR